MTQHPDAHNQPMNNIYLRRAEADLHVVRSNLDYMTATLPTHPELTPDIHKEITDFFSAFSTITYNIEDAFQEWKKDITENKRIETEIIADMIRRLFEHLEALDSLILRLRALAEQNKEFVTVKILIEESATNILKAYDMFRENMDAVIDYYGT